jgi:hypothetical protein
VAKKWGHFTTLNIYTHLFEDDDAAASDAMEDLIDV